MDDRPNGGRRDVQVSRPAAHHCYEAAGTWRLVRDSSNCNGLEPWDGNADGQAVWPHRQAAQRDALALLDPPPQTQHDAAESSTSATTTLVSVHSTVQ
jgi:hypothetical protein